MCIYRSRKTTPCSFLGPRVGTVSDFRAPEYCANSVNKLPILPGENLPIFSRMYIVGVGIVLLDYDRMADAAVELSNMLSNHTA